MNAELEILNDLFEEACPICGHGVEYHVRGTNEGEGIVAAFCDHHKTEPGYGSMPGTMCECEAALER